MSMSISIRKLIKYGLDIDNINMNENINNIYNLIELEFHKFIKKSLDEIKVDEIKVDEIKVDENNNAPKCSLYNALLYADKFLNSYTHVSMRNDMIHIINYLNKNYLNIYNEYMLSLNLLDTNEYVIALEILQDIIMAHLVFVNNNCAYKNVIFANNIYSLVITLCSKITSYDFSDINSGVEFPSEYMQWINSVENMLNIDNINYQHPIICNKRYMCYVVILGLIEYIIKLYKK